MMPCSLKSVQHYQPHLSLGGSEETRKVCFIAFFPNPCFFSSALFRDTSCAAIVASALLELDTYRPGKGFLKLATNILNSLSLHYLAGPLSDAVLLQNHHDCGSNVCTVIETDYYFLEALLRLKKKG